MAPGRWVKLNCCESSRLTLAPTLSRGATLYWAWPLKPIAPSTARLAPKSGRGSRQQVPDELEDSEMQPHLSSFDSIYYVITCCCFNISYAARSCQRHQPYSTWILGGKTLKLLLEKHSKRNVVSHSIDFVNRVVHRSDVAFIR